MGRGREKRKSSCNLVFEALIAIGIGMIMSLFLESRVAVVEAVVFDKNVSDYISGDWGYKLDENGDAIITSYYGNDDEIILEEKIGGHIVVGFGRPDNSWLFQNYQTLRKITLPDTIKSIDAAFYGCEQLSEIKLPDQLQVIGRSAFSYCSSLESIHLPSSVEVIKENAFYLCDSLTSIQFPSSLKKIGKGAFTYCNSLKSILLPSGLEEIGSTAFQWCSCLNDVRLEEGNDNLCLENGILYNAAKTDLIRVFDLQCRKIELEKGVQRIEAYAFLECDNLRSIVLPNTLEFIDDYAFMGLKQLQNLVIPESVTEIGMEILYGSAIYSLEINGPIQDLNNICRNCGNLGQVSLPDGLRTVSGFKGCSSLKKIILPESVETLEKNAFFNSGILSITIPSGTISIQEGALSAPSLEKIIVAEDNACFYSRSEGLYNKEHVLLVGCVQGGEIQISEGCYRIGENAFWNNKQIQKIKIPDTVKEIGFCAFSGCSNLTSIEMGDQLTRIEVNAFWNTEFLNREGKWVGGVCYLGSYAISYNGKQSFLGNMLVIRKGCTLIADGCFFKASSQPGDPILEYLLLPESLKYIGENAFRRNDSLRAIMGGCSLTVIGDNAFADCNKLERLFLQGEKIHIGKYAFGSCGQLLEIMIDAKETELEEGCFNACYRCKTIVLPNLNIPIRLLFNHSYNTNESNLVLTNMSAKELNNEKQFFDDCPRLKLYFSFDENEFALESILWEQKITVSYKDEWHLCCFLVYGEMKKLSVLPDGVQVPDPPVTEDETYYVTSEGPVLSSICWDLDGDGIADEMPERIHGDIKAEALYSIWEKEHDWIENTVLQELTCTQDRVVSYYCARCGEEKQEVTKAQGHVFSEDWTIDKEATCIEMGIKSHHCTREGCLERISATPILAEHTWDVGVITLEPQVGREGEKTYTCTICGEQKRESIAALPEQTGNLVSSEPGESLIPIESVMPNVSDMPSGSIQPGVTVEPLPSDAPERTKIPAHSPVPSSVPDGTKVPENSSVPPGNSELPQRSDQPSETEFPEKSMEPGKSEEPMVSSDHSPQPTNIDANVTPFFSQNPSDKLAGTTFSLAPKKQLIINIHVKSSYSKIILNWKKVKKDTQYWIYRSEKKNGKKKLLKKLQENQTSYSDKHVTVGRAYYYQIKVMQVEKGESKFYCHSKICKATLKMKKAPVVRIRKGRQGNIRYLEITLRKYTGKRLEIFYRKRKVGAYRKLKLRTNDISKMNRLRVKYLSSSGKLFFKFRTYDKKGKIRIYSHYTKVKKIKV